MPSLNEVMDINSRSSHKAKQLPKKLDHLRIEHAENGGHIVEHHFKQGEGPYREAESHVFGKDDSQKLLAHIAEHLGMKGEAKEESAEKSEGGGVAAE